MQRHRDWIKIAALIEIVAVVVVLGIWLFAGLISQGSTCDCLAGTDACKACLELDYQYKHNFLVEMRNKLNFGQWVLVGLVFVAPVVSLAAKKKRWFKPKFPGVK